MGYSIVSRLLPSLATKPAPTLAEVSDYQVRHNKNDNLGIRDTSLKTAVGILNEKLENSKFLTSNSDAIDKIQNCVKAIAVCIIQASNGINPDQQLLKQASEELKGTQKTLFAQTYEGKTLIGNLQRALQTANKKDFATAGIYMLDAVDQYEIPKLRMPKVDVDFSRLEGLIGNMTKK